MLHVTVRSAFKFQIFFMNMQLRNTRQHQLLQGSSDFVDTTFESSEDTEETNNSKPSYGIGVQLRVIYVMYRYSKTYCQYISKCEEGFSPYVTRKHERMKFLFVERDKHRDLCPLQPVCTTIKLSSAPAHQRTIVSAFRVSTISAPVEHNVTTFCSYNKG
jgi:hypothetical protein